MRRTLRSALAAGAVVALAAAGCGGTGSPKSGGGQDRGNGPIIIGSVHPLTGGLAGDGKLMDDAVHLAVDDINKAGGIKALGGRKLRVMSGNSEGKPEAGQSEAQRLVQSGAVALVGTYQSDVTLNVSAVAERNKVPLLIDVAVADQILAQGYKYTFRIQPDASAMGRQGADDLAAIAQQSGTPVKKVAYLHESSDFGTSVYKAFKNQAESKGITVAKEISYSLANFNDATTQIAQAAAVSPDVIVATGYYADSLLIAKTVASVQPKGVRAVFGVANGAFDNDQFPTDAGALSEGYLSTNYHFDATSDEMKRIGAAFTQKYGAPMRTAAVLSYQAVQVIAAGLEQAKSTDTTALRDAVAKVQIADPLLAFGGPIAFDEKGQNRNATPIVMQVIDGSVRQVYPQPFAEEPLRFPAPPAKG